jgi:ATP-dependent DNA helicase RecG
MNQESINSLKGIGEKTGKLFQKIGVFTVEDLLEYYPRAYDAYEEPAVIGQLKPDTIMTASGMLSKAPGVNRYRRVQVITADLKDSSGTLKLTWYNMPYLHSTLKPGIRFVFRGRVVIKRNRLTMEQPEVFTEDAYKQIVHSMQPVYGQTRGLSNKTIVRAQKQALSLRRMVRDYMPADLRKKHELAEYNFAIEHIHFPTDRKELLFARRRLVFDEFFLFLIAVRRLKEGRDDKKSSYTIPLSSEVEKIKDNLPYSLTGAQQI